MQTRVAKQRKFLPTFERVEPVVLDHTATNYFKKCSRLYFFRMVLGYTQEVQTYQTIFDFGNAVHKFDELLEKSNGDFKAAMAAIIKFQPSEGTPQKFEHLDLKRLYQTCELLYEDWKREKAAGAMKLIMVGDKPAVEQIFNVEFPDGEFIGGRFDKLVKWNGSPWPRDRKTTTKDVRWFERGLDPNDQATRYIWAAGKFLLEKVEGIIYDVVQNLKTQGPKLVRHTVSKTTWQLEQWVQSTMAIHKRIDECRETDVWPMEETQCSYCDFARVCRAGNELQMSRLLKENYKFEPWDFTREKEDA